MSEKENVKKTPALDNYGRDLTKAAREGKLDPVIGRDKEIKRLGQILTRRKKNNAVLIGYPGVGKTVLIEGLAQKIIKQDCSALLHNKRIILLDIGSLVAGTKYRGQFEERMKSIMKETEENPDIILFIDEIHNLIGAGAASGSNDASNMIKPALANGTLQLVGATTIDEYQKHFEKDGALTRRFQKVLLAPPTTDETIKILTNIKKYYEDHHSVQYSDEVINLIVKLAERYMADKHFPDKAIDVMDEVGSYVRSEVMGLKLPDNILEKEEKVVQIKLEKKVIIAQQRYEEAAEYRDKEQALIKEIEVLKEEWLKKAKNSKIKITAEHVATIISAISGVPVNKLTSDEYTLLSNLESVFNEHVIGQEKAVSITVKQLQKARLGIKNPNKPTTLLYLGASGIGKSKLAKSIAKYYFDDEDALIQVNMNELGEKHSASRLGGSPPGYVGYEEGGELTSKVKAKPYSVILLDEIEKAHPDVFNVLLQLMDEGFMVDSQGFKVDFRNTVIIMTSNIGTKELTNFGNGIGYGKSAIVDTLEAENVMLKQVKKQLKSEFLGRINEIVVFNMLDKAALYKVIDIEIADLRTRVKEHFDLTLTDAVKDLIIENGYNDNYGARFLKNSISKLVEDSLVDLILKGVEPDSMVIGDIENSKVVYKTEPIKKTKKK